MSPSLVFAPMASPGDDWLAVSDSRTVEVDAVSSVLVSSDSPAADSLPPLVGSSMAWPDDELLSESASWNIQAPVSSSLHGEPGFEPDELLVDVSLVAPPEMGSGASSVSVPVGVNAETLMDMSSQEVAFVSASGASTTTIAVHFHAAEVKVLAFSADDFDPVGSASA